VITERLVYVILISEKPIPANVKANVAACVILAFPEQLKDFDPISGNITLRDGYTCQPLTYEDIKFKDPKSREEFRSWVYSIEKGVHDLPQPAELYKVFGTPGWGQIYILGLLEKICPEFATSAVYRRKWSVIDGKDLGKMLIIGIYSAAPSEAPPAPPAVPVPVSALTQPETPKPSETMPAKKYCKYCGVETLLEAIYCPKCGKKQVEEEIRSIKETEAHPEVSMSEWEKRYNFLSLPKPKDRCPFRNSSNECVSPAADQRIEPCTCSAEKKYSRGYSACHVYPILIE